LFDIFRGGNVPMDTYLGKRTALIVEDDPRLLAEMTAFVQKILRFEVLAAYDYHGALAQLENHMPDVISIDLRLPRESGYELCEHIRRQPHFAKLPILVTGEDAFPEDMAHAEEAGANAFLEKPFSMVSFARNVSALLEGPKASRPGVRLLRLP
jgi:CheY-like chemotaxis protein